MTAWGAVGQLAAHILVTQPPKKPGTHPKTSALRLRCTDIADHTNHSLIDCASVVEKFETISVQN